METYRDRTKKTTTRVKDLLSRMTLDEKIAQLGSISVSPMLVNGKLSPKKAKDHMPNGIGQMTAVARASGLPADELAQVNNDTQKYLCEQTRLGIPAIVHEECLSGYRAKGATIFPQNIGLAGTWDPELVGRMTEVIRQQMRAAGVHQGLAPVLDIARDPRWGRTEETFGEDPYLVSRMAVSYVRGLQGEDISKGVIATLKHFAGHGLPEGGLNCAPSHITPRLLREVYLYPFEKAVKEGGVLSVMNAYHEIDGIPCGASENLLTNILRKEWGFDGIVVSDYGAINQLMSVHKIAQDYGEAARLALTAGIDIELPRSLCYAEPLKKAVESGAVSMELIDRSVSRILDIKFRLGLFENPYVKAAKAATVIDTPSQRKLALEAARKSIILLKNEGGLLPLTKGIRAIAVIGPNADSKRNMLGDYTYPSNAGYEMVTDEKTQKLKVVWKDADLKSGIIDVPEIKTILAGIKVKARANTKVLYAKGCDTIGDARDGFKKAINAVKSAEVAVVVVGGESGLIPECTSGEMRDSAVLGFPGIQGDLVKAVFETGTPVVLVLVNGRPNALGWMAEEIPAIIGAWLPGEEGGRAVADVLFGDYNPGGKLPVSLPVTAGQIPVYYGHKPSGRKSSGWGDYIDCIAGPRFAFGHGLSYTTFQFSNLKIGPKKISHPGVISVKVDVKNTGKIAGDEVVQLYINDVVATVTRPVKELKGFKRTNLQPGEKKTVEFSLPTELLTFYDKKMKRIVEPGTFKVMIGRSSADILLEGEFEVSGK
jgi:beta-glucosidase